jgi:hypothetical protein
MSSLPATAYLAEYWRERYRMVPALLRESVIEPVIAALPDSRETRIGEALRRAKKFLRSTRGPFDERLLALKEVFPAPTRQTSWPAAGQRDRPGACLGAAPVGSQLGG